MVVNEKSREWHIRYLHDRDKTDLKKKQKTWRASYQLLLSCQGFRHLEASATSQRAREPAARSLTEATPMCIRLATL